MTNESLTLEVYGNSVYLYHNDQLLFEAYRTRETSIDSPQAFKATYHSSGSYSAARMNLSLESLYESILEHVGTYKLPLTIERMKSFFNDNELGPEFEAWLDSQPPVELPDTI